MITKYYKCTDPFTGKTVKLEVPVHQVIDRSSRKVIFNGQVIEEVLPTNTLKEAVYPQVPFTDLEDVIEVTKGDYDAFIPSEESLEFIEIRKMYKRTADAIAEKDKKINELRAAKEASAAKKAAVKKAKEDKKPK